MQDLPHHYVVAALASADSDVDLDAANVPRLRSASPAEFGGPGDRWSPETLLVGAVADCFVLTFRGVAKASKLEWLSVACDASGTLDRVDGVVRFTTIDLHARLVVPPGVDDALARRVL